MRCTRSAPYAPYACSVCALIVMAFQQAVMLAGAPSSPSAICRNNDRTSGAGAWVVARRQRRAWVLLECFGEEPERGDMPWADDAEVLAVHRRDLRVSRLAVSPAVELKCGAFVGLA
jgi:hypothetical protein